MKRPPAKWIIVVLLVGGGIVAATFWFLENHFLPFRYAGTLEATKVDLSARLPAAIDQVRVQEGDRVTEGETVVVLACEDIKIEDRLAHQNYDRAVQLSKSSLVSQETMDQLRNRKDEADTRLQWCTIESPVNGKVLSRYHEPGEWMNPGTKILTVANVRDIWAFIYVPQPLVARLSPGMKVKGYLPELNDREFDGLIVKINDEAEFTPKMSRPRRKESDLFSASR